MIGQDYWEGKYKVLELYYNELLRALGFITPEFGEVHDIHPEAVAKARRYRYLVTSCSLENPEEWDD